MYNIAKSNITQTNEIHIPLAPFLSYLYTLTCIQEDSLTKTSGATHLTWGICGSNIVINDIQCTSKRLCRVERIQPYFCYRRLNNVFSVKYLSKTTYLFYSKNIVNILAIIIIIIIPILSISIWFFFVFFVLIWLQLSTPLVKTLFFVHSNLS